MKLRVAVNQPQSIFRGFNCDFLTMEIEVDLHNAPRDIVEYISEYLHDGKIMRRSSPNQMIKIPQPDLDGLYQAIRKEMHSLRGGKGN